MNVKKIRIFIARKHNMTNNCTCRHCIMIYKIENLLKKKKSSIAFMMNYIISKMSGKTLQNLGEIIGHKIQKQ